MAHIKIKDKIILIDDEDFNRIKKYKWYLNDQGRVTTVLPDSNGKWTINIKLHRYILWLDNEDLEEVDHIDHNPLNNQKSNLRLATRAQNQRNIPKTYADMCYSKYKGVTFNKLRSKWKAATSVRDRTYHLFNSTDEHECAYAYNYAVQKIAKQFAYLNKDIPPISPERCKEIEDFVMSQLNLHKLIK